jgi:hypothetical protein
MALVIKLYANKATAACARPEKIDAERENRYAEREDITSGLIQLVLEYLI